MAARGRGLFSLNICIENLSDLLVRNHWTDFKVTLQKCFLCNPLSRVVQAVMIRQKTWPPGGWGGVEGGAYFPCIYRNFKIFLSEITGPISI